MPRRSVRRNPARGYDPRRADRDHDAAWADPKPGTERGMVLMIKGLKEYCKAHERQFGSPIGDDGVLGDDGALPILEGLFTLLNGEHGRLDGGTLDRLLRNIADDAQIEEIEQ